MKQTPVPPFSVGTKWLRLEFGHNIEWGSGGSGILWRVKPILTVLAILFHLFCRGLSEHMYKYCTRQTRTYIGMPKKHILRASRNGFGGVGECLDDLGAEA